MAKESMKIPRELVKETMEKLYTRLWGDFMDKQVKSKAIDNIYRIITQGATGRAFTREYLLDKLYGSREQVLLFRDLTGLYYTFNRYNIGYHIIGQRYEDEHRDLYDKILRQFIPPALMTWTDPVGIVEGLSEPENDPVEILYKAIKEYYKK